MSGTDPMTSAPEGRRGDPRRRAARRRRDAVIVAGFLVLVAGLVYVVLAATGDGSSEPAAADTATTATTTGEETFVEAGDEAVSPEDLRRAKFISVTLEGSGGLTAYSLTPETQEFGRLVELLPGREIDLNAPHDPDATIIFVGQNRSTISFEFDSSDAILVRGDRAWQVESGVGDVIRSLGNRS